MMYELIDTYEKFLDSGTFERLSALDYLNDYSRPLLSTRRIVFLIPLAGSTSPDQLKADLAEMSIDEAANGASLGTSWIYNQFPYVYCNHELKPLAHDLLPAQLQANFSNWRSMGAPTYYFLCETVSHNCKIIFSVQLGIVVIVCNALKIVIILAIFLVLLNDPLLTIEDAAVASLMKEHARCV
jgi:hypothetical protein